VVEWSIPEDNSVRVPVRLVLEGNGSTGLIYHVYDYTSFHVGPSEDASFVQPCGMVCTSSNQTFSTVELPVIPCISTYGECTAWADSSTWEDASIWMLIVADFASGAIVACLVIYAVTKCKAKGSSSAYAAHDNVYQNSAAITETTSA
jgi:hypothetical protein